MNIQQLRAQIDALQSATMDENKNFRSAYDEGKFDALTAVDALLDSLQEEPIFKVGDTIQKKGNNSIRYSIINKTSDGYRALRGLSDTIVIWFSEQDQWELVKEPVSEDLEEASRNYADNEEYGDDVYFAIKAAFKVGAKWQKEHLWKPADGDDLPDIDREVIALLDNGKVVFAHRPPKYWDGKNIITGKVTRHYPKTYDKGGWNIPNVKWWLDVDKLPNVED